MADAPETVRLADVFVTADPQYTYTARESAKLEEAVMDHLEERDKILVITGPTKIGKTVLIDHVVPREVENVVKAEGPMISGAQVLWQHIVDALEWFAEVGQEESESKTATKGTGGNLQVDGGVVKGGVKHDRGRAQERVEKSSRSAIRTAEAVGRKALIQSRAALVIDDFHHIEAKVQAALVKQLKSIVAQRQAPIILIAVPHHAADVVRAEAEMQGRVKHVKIPEWGKMELKEIARLGYDVLNVNCPDDLADYLATVAWESPHLMQVLCRELAKSNGIRETQQERVTLRAPEKWDDFLHDVAVENTDPKMLEKLATGAQSRSKRDPRPLHGGGTTDLYRALLTAIATTGPKRSLTYDDLRDGLQDILVKLPQSNEVTSHLQKLDRIAAAEVGPGRDPVLEYDADKVLHVVDPFFAFRLRWGPPVLRTGDSA